MSSSITIFTKSDEEKLLAQLKKLSADELTHLVQLTRLIRASDEKYRLSVANKVAHYLPMTLYHFCEHEDRAHRPEDIKPIRDFCENESYDHYKTWATSSKSMESNGIPAYKITPVDGTKPCSVLFQYIGSGLLGLSEKIEFYLEKKALTEKLSQQSDEKFANRLTEINAKLAEFEQYNTLDESWKNKAMARVLLDESCRYGFFQALQARCKVNQDIIKSRFSRNEDVTEAKGQLVNDCNKLGNLYWAVGYFQAAVYLLDISHYCQNIAAEESQEEVSGSTAFAAAFQKEAAKHFLRGQELCKYKQSGEDKEEKGSHDNVLAINKICGPDGLLVFNFGSWSEAEEAFLTPVDQKELSKLSKEAFNEIKRYMQQLREKNNIQDPGSTKKT